MIAGLRSIPSEIFRPIPILRYSDHALLTESISYFRSLRPRLLTLLAWVINYVHYSACDEITYQDLTSTIEVRGMDKLFHPKLYRHIITYPCIDVSLFVLGKGAPGRCITTAIWSCRNPFGHWQCSFQIKFIMQSLVTILSHTTWYWTQHSYVKYTCTTQVTKWTLKRRITARPHRGDSVCLLCECR